MMKQNMLKKFKQNNVAKMENIKKMKKSLTKILKEQEIFNEDQECLINNAMTAERKAKMLEMDTEVNQAIKTTESIFK
jgi:hypothetical protein